MGLIEGNTEYSRIASSPIFKGNDSVVPPDRSTVRMLGAATVCEETAKQYRISVIRDDGWLVECCKDLLYEYFPDVPVLNPVQPAFGRAWKTRLGLISLAEGRKISHIRLNALFRLDAAPEVAAIMTLAHELVHYAHGFGSTLPQMHPYPHRGGIVNHELRKRRLGCFLEPYRTWIDEEWSFFHDSYRAIFT